MQSTLTLRSLPLAITHISKLSAAGFETVGDLRDVGIIDLSKGEPEKMFGVCFYNINISCTTLLM